MVVPTRRLVHTMGAPFNHAMHCVPCCACSRFQVRAVQAVSTSRIRHSKHQAPGITNIKHQAVVPLVCVPPMMGVSSYTRATATPPTTGGCASLAPRCHGPMRTTTVGGSQVAELAAGLSVRSRSSADASDRPSRRSPAPRAVVPPLAPPVSPGWPCARVPPVSQSPQVTACIRRCHLPRPTGLSRSHPTHPVGYIAEGGACE